MANIVRLWLSGRIDCNFMDIQFLYRALSQEDRNDLDTDGFIYAKDVYSNAGYDAAVGSGAASRWVHCTKNRFVALYYAEEFPSSQSAQEIVCIDVSKLPDDIKVIDVSSGYKLKWQKARNFAMNHQVVLVAHQIPEEAVICSIDTSQWSYDLGQRRTFNKFVQEFDEDICLELDAWARDEVPPQVTNEAHRGSVERSTVYAQGSFKTVYSGRYTKGLRAGHPSVNKFASAKSYVGDEIFWQDDIAAVNKANEIINKFNAYLDKRYDMSVKVLMSKAQVWSMLDDGCKHLVEPHINSHFIKFNSNSGYEVDNDVCKALSHYSYVLSQGQLLLCDLQGGAWWSKDGDEDMYYYVLTDPAVQSASGRRQYGAADLGQDGIDNFMFYHQCGDLCNPGWPTCPTARRVFRSVRGTSSLSSDGKLFGTKYFRQRGNRQPALMPEIVEDEEDLFC